MESEDKSTKPKTDQPSAGWVFKPGDSAQNSDSQSQPTAGQSPSNAPSPDPDTVSWTASEYTAHERGASWYLGLGLGAIILAAVVYLLTRDYISSGMIVVVGIVFGGFASKKPRVLQYIIDDNGITIGTKSYSFAVFKSFSISEEGGLHSLLLMPLKRFMPMISVYYDPKDEEKIFQKIAVFLPFEEYRADLVDRMMHKIRF